MSREKRIETPLHPSPRQKLRLRAALVCCALGIAGGLLGCGNEGGQAAQPTDVTQKPNAARQPDDEVTAGSLGLELEVGDAHLDTFTYTIIGGQQFQKSGTINVSNSTRVTALIGGIPFGTGYSIAVSAQSAAPVSTCSGSASFQITTPAPTTVPLHITCKHDDTVVVAVAQPAPVPPAAVAALFLMLLGLGVLSHRLSGARGSAA